MKNFPSITTVRTMLRLSCFLSVNTVKLIAPRLLDYLQPSCSLDHLKNEQASWRRFVYGKRWNYSWVVTGLLNNTRSGLFLDAWCCGVLGKLLAVFSSHLLLYITAHFVYFCSSLEWKWFICIICFCKSLKPTELHFLICTMEIIAIWKPPSKGFGELVQNRVCALFSFWFIFWLEGDKL